MVSDIGKPLTRERLSFIKKRISDIKRKIKSQKKLMEMKADYSVLIDLKGKKFNEIPKEKLNQLILLSFQGNQKAKELLFQSYAPEIESIARRIWKNKPMDEKIGLGQEGLLIGLKNLQSLEKAVFYFDIKIKGGIKDYYRGIERKRKGIKEIDITEIKQLT